MTNLSLALFDAVLVTIDGGPPTAPLWSKTLALLAYLAAEAGRPYHRETLAGLLWPEEPEAAARHSLRQALTQLHQALGESDPPVLLVTAQTVAFNPAWSGAVDVAEFTQLLAVCQRHPHRGLETCRACAERLERAVALYRGDFLAGLFLKNCVEFEEWVLVQRERFSRQALFALHTLANHYGRCGGYGPMEQMARRQIEIDPYYEDAHRQLLQALAWSGRPHAALAHYAALCQMLAQELAALPERQTLALHEQIQAGSLPPPVLPPLHNWPAPPTPLIGRESELTALAELLQAPEVRLVTVVGTAGIGKTRLAQEAAAREALAFADGACFVPLAGVTATEFVVPAIAAALELSLAGAADLQSRLCTLLKEMDLLLVLDNFEHLLSGAPLVTELLAACPRLVVLSTSREPLHVRAEQQFPLLPLRLPEREHLPVEGRALVAALAGIPAVDLFVQRARAVQPAFALDEGNAATVSEICIRLEGLPLAIELAAAQVYAVTLPEMLARLENRLSFLVGGFRDLPPRQRTLRAALDWSYSLLSADEKRLFARLAVFVAGCMLEAAEAVCGGAELASVALAAGLQGLVEKGLLQRREVVGESRFTLLETVREYAGEWLAESGEQEAGGGRYARYYMELAERLASRRPSEGVTWLERLEVERNNLRAALQWALERGDWEVAARLAAAVWMVWESQGDYVEGLHWLEAVLSLPFPGGRPAEAAGDANLTRAWIRVLAGAGVLAGELHDYARALGRLEEALSCSRQVGDSNLTAFVLAWLGWAAGDSGDYDRSIACYEESLALYREIGGVRGRASAAFVLNGLGNVAQYRDDFAAARAYYEESLTIRRELNDLAGVICTLANLGFTNQMEGDQAGAGRRFRESLVLAQQTQDKMHIAAGMFGLAAVALATGQTGRAARLLGQTEYLLRSLGTHFGSFGSTDYESTVAAVRAGLGEAAFAAAWAEGQSLPLEQAVALALQEYDTVTG